MLEEIDSAIESEEPSIETTVSTGVESADSKKARAAWMRSNKKCIGYIRQHLTPDDSDAITFISPEQLDDISVLGAVLESDINTNTLMPDDLPLKMFGPKTPNSSEVCIMRNQVKKGNRPALQANKLLIQSTVTADAEETLPAADSFLLYNALGAPTSRKIAMSSKFAPQWLKAKSDELDNIRKYKVFQDAILPEGETAIFLKWVYKLVLLTEPTGDTEANLSRSVINSK
ncbi:protein of unknown function [Taphrina deformans PYCC 5710]|uniref:Uncharacterized protein n=1 Tax=Taphrina deformans (strain PYCC 5710 / ATCC 11124 / CBS 356.35 / IMI 108563 / JCM 9778 / NBRC 8474) TaxID=1097556 RepID=R4XF51_TAPDE|nr:protein of unknown function [Taphrina deformans PYCC 5710]|eukprot:CCG84497.1 protein of unknown function [Taphrina deformans PYCC 5710]